jgi:hypothetical protein
MELAATVETYNPNQLVTYKKVPGTYAAPEAPEYIMTDVADLEWELHNGREYRRTFFALNSKIEEVQELMSDWYDSNYDKEEVLEAIANILDIEPIKTLRVTGTISYTLDVEVPMKDVKDFDARYMLNDELVITSNTHVIEIESWNVDDADVEW